MTAVPRSGAAIEGAPGLPVTVRTPDEQWAYAMVFRREGDIPDTRALVVRVRIVVSAGTVGVGWLNRRRTQFIDEIPVAAGPEATVDLVAVQPFDLGPLMIRNWSRDGASTATVLGIECFGVTADAVGEADSDSHREPPLSEPTVLPDWSRYYGTRGRGFVEHARVLRFEGLSEPIDLTWSDGRTEAGP